MMNISAAENATSSEGYFQTNTLGLSLFFINYFIGRCLEEEGSGTKGMSDFLTVIANDYFGESLEVVLLYDESWDISGMIEKLTISTNKAFVSYFLPLDETLAQRIQSKPSDHFTHKLLPKATAFLIFVRDEYGFFNIHNLMSVYPWWNKRARVVIMVKDTSSQPTKGILAVLEKEKIFNGVVVTATNAKLAENTTDSSPEQSSSMSSVQQHNKQKPKQNNNHAKEDSSSAENKTAQSFVALQIVALDPFPEEGHTKEAYVARWLNGELQMMQPIFQEKIENLRQHKLHICVFEFPPLVIRTEVGKNKYTYRGLEVSLLHELSRLLNFTYEFFEPPDGERWGKDLGNNTWTGLIGETQRNADFGFASVFLLDNRDKAVDVSTPYDQDQGCFAVPRPEALQHWLGLVLPFSWQVWACVIAMAIVAGPTFTIITRPLGMDRSMTVGRGIMCALGSLVSAQKAPHAKSHALRTFIVSWLIFCWLDCILYRVALIVSLTVGPNAFKIDILKQLARSGLKWGGYKEVLNTFSNTTDSVDDKMFERFEIVTNTTAALERVATKGDFALLDSGKLLRYAEKGKYFNGYSSLIHVTKECPTRYNVGFVMPIGSPFLEKVNELIRRLQNAGIIGKWYNDILHEAIVKNPNRAKGGVGKSYGLDIDDLKLCLVLILCGHFVSFLVLIGEHVLASYRSGRVSEMGSSILRKVSSVSGLTLTSSRGNVDASNGSINPSIIITETEDTDEESTRTESLRSLPLEVEYGWCQCMGERENGALDAVSASLGDIKAVSCRHFKRFGEE